MRYTRFWELMNDEFGADYAPVLVQSLVLPDSHHTAEEALAAGVDPKIVWQHICTIQEVPEDRWYGINKKES